MPENNKLTQQDLKDALKTRELKIAKFDPPSAPKSEDPLPSIILSIQEESAEHAARERAAALFQFFNRFIAQVAQDELSSQQIVRSLETVTRDIAEIRAILLRNNLT